MATPRLEALRLSKTYEANGVPVHALRELDLTIAAGEFVAVVGPSGSGKTSFLNLAGGLDRPSAGLIRLDGRDIGGLSKRELTLLRLHEIGFIFQEYNLVPVLSARENVEFVLLLQGVDRRTRTDKAMAMLEEVGLRDLAHRRPAELSGGQRQRVAVARAIASEPKIVLADEPTANLDSETATALVELLRGLNRKKGTTFVFSTHDPLVMDRARRVVRLRDGRKVEDVSRPESA